MERNGLIEIPRGELAVAEAEAPPPLAPCTVCGRPRGESICAACRTVIWCEAMDHKWHPPREGM